MTDRGIFTMSDHPYRRLVLEVVCAPADAVDVLDFVDRKGKLERAEVHPEDSEPENGQGDRGVRFSTDSRENPRETRERGIE